MNLKEKIFALLSLLLVLLTLQTNSLFAQDINLFYGDSVLLKLENYRGNLVWQQSNYYPGNAAVWTDISGSQNKNIWVVPPYTKQYRGKVSEGGCYAFPNNDSYTDEKIVLVNLATLTVNTDSVTNITGATAKCGGEIMSLGGTLTATEKGIIYDTIPYETLLKGKTNEGPGIGKFTSNLNNLLENKNYFAWSYFRSSLGYYYYGPRRDFTTKSRVDISISLPSNVSYFTGTLNSEIILNAPDTITERGFCYMTKQAYLLTGKMPDTSQNKMVVGSGTGLFSKQLTNLQSNLTYYARAYAKTSKGKVYYSVLGGFTTLTELHPVIFPLREITSSTASFSAAIRGVGSYVWYGICYATTPNPDTSQLGLSHTGNFNTNFSVGGRMLNGLAPNTKYYARYFLKTTAGNIIYSNSLSFTTLLSSQPRSTITFYPPLMDKNKYTLDAVYEGQAGVASKGFYYQKESNIDFAQNDGLWIVPSDSLVSLPSGPNNFSTVLDKLTSPGGGYVAKSFAILSNGTYLESSLRFFYYYNFAEAETRIKSVSNIQTSNATIETFAQKVGTNGSGNISARGICYSTEPNVNIDDSKVNGGITEGDLSISLSGLEANTTYYLRPYVTINAYSYGYYTYYGDEQTIQTLPETGLIAKTEGIIGINANNATFKGSITGTLPVKNRGFCWTSSGTPTINSSIIKESSGTGNYSLTVSGLTMGSTYNYRAFGTSTTGTVVYGTTKTFTMVNQPVTLLALDANGVGSNTAFINTTLEINGSVQIASKGVCYGLNSEPSISGTKTNDGIVNESYASSLTGLTASTMYYARSYLTDNLGKTYYGNEINFTTQASATFTVTTNIMGTLNIFLEYFEAPFSGNVSGTGTITARGVCYSTTNNPTISGTKVTMGSGLGAFNSLVSNLMPATIYYYRAYATSSTGITVYGALLSTNPTQTITTSPVNTILSTSAYSGGYTPLTTSGTITATGVCWGTTPFPLITGNKTVNGVNSGTYSSFMSGLTVNTKYYVRSYATKSTGVTYYGNTIGFNTFQSGYFVLTTANAQSVSEETVQASGTVFGNGGIQIKGFCYGTSPNPDIVGPNSQVFTYNVDSFTSQITGLTPSTLYYMRAYATSSSGPTYYGNEVTFTTLPAANITVTTAAITNNLGSEGTCGGTVSGTGTVTERGIIVSADVNPQAYAMSTNFPMGSGIGSFSGKFELTIPNKTFYIRAYASTIGGSIYYGNVLTLPAIMVLVNTQSPSEVWGVTAKVSGNITLFGTATIVQRGFCYDTIGNPTVAGLKTSNGSTAGSFSAVISGLAVKTGYYYRAYATNSSGATFYGKREYFFTQDHPSIFIDTRGTFGTTTTTAIVGGLIDNIGSELVTSRGVCWSQQVDPTIANTKTSDGTGNGIFVSNMTGLIASTGYYFRAYAITNLGKVVYGKTVFMSTKWTDPTIYGSGGGTGGGPVNDDTQSTPPNNGGGGTKGGTRYLVFGRANGPAKISCKEGSGFFDDTKGSITKIVEGEYSLRSYAQAEKDMNENLKKNFLGKGYSYHSETSAEIDTNFRYACIIEYRKKIPAWDCTSVLYTIGYGNSKGAAQNNAVTRKNKDINRGDLAPYKVVKDLNW
jgi:hypothetical protein